MISNTRLYLTDDGQVVEQDDPRAVGLLVCQNGELEKAEAEKYGLIGSRYDAEAKPKKDGQAKPEGPPVVEPKPLSRMNRDELVAAAVELEIEVIDTDTKAALIEKIEAARATS